MQREIPMFIIRLHLSISNSYFSLQLSRYSIWSLLKSEKNEPRFLHYHFLDWRPVLYVHQSSKPVAEVSSAIRCDDEKFPWFYSMLQQTCFPSEPPFKIFIYPSLTNEGGLNKRFNYSTSWVSQETPEVFTLNFAYQLVLRVWSRKFVTGFLRVKQNVLEAVQFFLSRVVDVSRKFIQFFTKNIRKRKR